MVWGLDLNQIGITGICEIEYIFQPFLYINIYIVNGKDSRKRIDLNFHSFSLFNWDFWENSLSFYVFFFLSTSSFLYFLQFLKRDCVALINVRSRSKTLKKGMDGRKKERKSFRLVGWLIILRFLSLFNKIFGIYWFAFYPYLEFTTHSKLNSESYK